MLVSASTQSSSMLCWLPPSPIRKAHSAWLLVKLVSVVWESHVPPDRQVLQRAVTSATHAARVG
jgi:hypothetical protein